MDETRARLDEFGSQLDVLRSQPLGDDFHQAMGDVRTQLEDHSAGLVALSSQHVPERDLALAVGVAEWDASRLSEGQLEALRSRLCAREDVGQQLKAVLAKVDEHSIQLHS